MVSFLPDALQIQFILSLMAHVGKRPLPIKQFKQTYHLLETAAKK